MAITVNPVVMDWVNLNGSDPVSVARLQAWATEVNATVGANTAEPRVVASTAAAKAIAAADRANLDVIFLADSGQALYFSAASSAAEALGPPITVIQPTAGTGRWLALALPPVASVAEAQLATGAVTAGKIADLAVTAGKMAANTMTVAEQQRVNVGDGVAVQKISYAVPYTQLTDTAGLTKTLTFAALGLQGILAGTVVEVVTGFVGCTSLDVSVGGGMAPAALCADVSVLTPDVTNDPTGTAGQSFFAAATQLTATFTATVENLNQLTAGQLYVHVYLLPVTTAVP